MGRQTARARAPTTQPYVLKTNMGAGHGGKSGRWASLKEVAESYAFVLTQLGVAQKGERASTTRDGFKEKGSRAIRPALFLIQI